MTLKEFLAAHPVTYRAFGAQVGAHPSQLSRWIKGERLPSLVQAAAIEQATDGLVPVSVWVPSADPARGPSAP